MHGVWGHSPKIVAAWLGPHPQYSPDIAPSDYYLFRNLQNILQEKNRHHKAEKKGNTSIIDTYREKKKLQPY